MRLCRERSRGLVTEAMTSRRAWMLCQACGKRVRPPATGSAASSKNASGTASGDATGGTNSTQIASAAAHVPRQVEPP
jgi:hypothetical protein